MNKKILIILALLVVVSGISIFVFYDRVPVGLTSFDRDSKALADTDQIRAKDSDGDGVPDWEESLWGTDPHKVDTNGDGISDAEEIAAKKRAGETATQAASATGSQPQQETLTSVLVDDSINALIQSGGKPLDPKVQEQLLATFAEKVKSGEYAPANEDPYALSDLHIVSTTNESAAQYRTDLIRIFTDFSNNYPGDDITFIQDFLNTNNGASEIPTRASLYKTLAKTLGAISVPSDISVKHVALMNTYVQISDAYLNIGHLFDDPLRGLVGIIQMENHLKALDTETSELGTFFGSYQ